MELITSFLESIISSFFYIIKLSWWIFIPLILILKIKDNWEGWLIMRTASNIERTVLEITPPPEVLKTPKAMENVLIGLAGGWHELNKRDKYWRGDIQDTFSLELVCNDRMLRFYVRCSKKSVSFVESKFYAQYPEAEIREVEDYFNNIPEKIPNEEWDMWGGFYGLVKYKQSDAWTIPIKTYMDWDDNDEDRIISPLSQLGEMALHMGKEEYVVVQTIISPVVTEIAGAAQRKIDEILGKEAPSQKKGMVESFFTFLFDFVMNLFRTFSGQEIAWSGGGDKVEEDSQQFSRYFNLTKGEQDTIAAIQMKDSKLKFKTSMHCMYAYKIGTENRARISDMNGFIRQFGSESLNGLRPMSGTYPTSNIYLFRKYQNKLRMRKLFFAMRTRWDDYILDPYYLSTEEIASVFHIPGQVAQSTGVSRVQSKTVEPPRNLIN